MTLNRRNVALAIVLAAIIGTATYFADAKIRQDNVQRYAQKFALLGTLRKSALEAYLATIRAELTFWSMSDFLGDIGSQLIQTWDALPAERTTMLPEFYRRDVRSASGENSDLEAVLPESGYDQAHKALHSLAEEFVSGRGYYDFFLIDVSGNIVYTVMKESDYATNLVDGPYRKTGLANVFRRALEDAAAAVHISDLKRYAPSNDDPAIFAARRMADSDGNPIGVLALQLPTAKIVDIMQFDAGMGESGETYLAGQDLLMRSDSRFSVESTILRTRVDTETVGLALDGRKGVDFAADYRGISVLSAYDSLDVDGYRWAVMAEVDEEEVRSETSGLGGVFVAIGALIYGLALWTIGLVSRLIWPADAGGVQVDSITDMDIG
jgi:methyl-accepting chemotaxis protein